MKDFFTAHLPFSLPQKLYFKIQKINSNRKTASYIEYLTASDLLNKLENEIIPYFRK